MLRLCDERVTTYDLRLTSRVACGVLRLNRAHMLRFTCYVCVMSVWQVTSNLSAHATCDVLRLCDERVTSYVLFYLRVRFSDGRFEMSSALRR